MGPKLIFKYENSKFLKKIKRKDKIKSMTILAIETSCDETAVAILKAKEGKMKILANVVASQIKIHQKYGGVYPTLAKREHQRNLPFVLKKALKKAGLKISAPEIDLIAVTIGPGLEPCLWTGINFAKTLSQNWKIPLFPVNHIESHILVNFFNQKYETIKKHLPAICLVVSGGHTQLLLMRDIGKYKIIGETRDDAAGECFDKTARILSLGYPGGPLLAKMAEELKTKNLKFKINLPRPMIYQKNYDFSFSGLKTAVLYDFQKRPKKIQKSERYKREMAKEIQQAIVDVLVTKTIRAVKEFKSKTIILGGGVAANKELRKKLKTEGRKLKINLLIPPPLFCTDNALMIAVTAYFHYLKLKNKGKLVFSGIEAKANLRL
jgi:N6-L-threonylcarbamoyladenine synthase